MISDVLSDAKYEIERYLTDPVFTSVYSDKGLRSRLEALMAGMEEIRVELDTLPVSDTEAIFASLKIEIEEKCKNASIRCKRIKISEHIEGLEVSLPQGRGERRVIISNADDASKLLNFPFENYRFLSGYNAVTSYGDGYIEAVVVPLDQTSTQELYEQLFGVTFLEVLENVSDEVSPKLEITYESSGRLDITISISPVSQYARVLIGNLPDRSLSLKIGGLNILQHDETVSYLEKYANSIFFQIDSVLGLPLTLQRTHTTIQSLSMSSSRAAFELKYPECRYDAEPLSLYWYARSADGMPLLQYLAYYQAIEFYFPVYSQVKAKRAVQTILKTPGFNVHNDTDVIRLVNAAKVGLGKGFGTERAQLEATIQECVDINFLRGFVEDNEGRKEFFIKRQEALDLEKIALYDTDDSLRKSVVNRIYDLRCRIVHTKTESDLDNTKSIYPFTQEANLLAYDIELIHYVAEQVLIVSSREFRL